MQEVNSYLRLAMMFGENQARTASTNIEKMCELILLDNYPNAMSSGEIVDALLLKYSFLIDFIHIFTHRFSFLPHSAWSNNINSLFFFSNSSILNSRISG